MTREQYKLESGKSRKLARKLLGWTLWAQGKRLLEEIKIECGLVASRQFEAGQMELTAQHEKDDAELKAAGVI